MGCGASVENDRPSSVEKDDGEQNNGSNDSKYRDTQAESDRSAAPTTEVQDPGLTPQEKAQVEAIRERRRSSRRICSLATDDSMRHYRMVTGNQRDDDEYFDASKVRVQASPTAPLCSPADEQSSDCSSPTLSRHSSVRRAESFNGLKKTVSFTNGPSQVWRAGAK